METVTQINTLKKSLNENKVQLGCWLTLSSSTVTEICANAGFDWLTIDTEHAPSDHDTVLRQLQAASRFSSSPVVRVANNDATQIKRVLDLGFLSLIVPNISDKNSALLAAKSSLYPPKGFRGISANTRANLFGSDQNYLKNFNNELLLITQIESKIGYDNIDEICEVDTADVLFIGPQDLAADLGHLGNPSHPDVKKVMNDIVKKTLSNKKIPGILALNLDDAKYWIDQGVLLISVASDQFLLSEQTKKILEFFKK